MGRRTKKNKKTELFEVELRSMYNCGYPLAYKTSTKKYKNKIDFN